MRPIVTERLELVPATPTLVRAALEGPMALAVQLGASVPPTWPPEYPDPASLDFTLTRLAEGPEKCGFRLLDEGPEPGVIRFELTRSSWLVLRPTLDLRRSTLDS
jgi:hypothetical protein